MLTFSTLGFLFIFAIGCFALGHTLQLLAPLFNNYLERKGETQ